MDNTTGKQAEKHICAGLLAHVDAGKTTLAESILYLTGSIRKFGRVDHQDAFLDTFALERARGITIFSKQAEFMLGDTCVTLLDTPGHVDFSAEMERTLQVLDYAVLVISGADGVQGHVVTLWRLLKRYRIPIFLWINKMDQPGTDRQELQRELCKKLDDRCMYFGKDQDRAVFLENLAMCEEKLLETYLETGEIRQDDIRSLIRNRKVFPCYYGSALKMEGVEELLEGLEHHCLCPRYGEEFGARIYKIARDDQGNRLTHMKITGGSLKVKTLLTNRHDTGGISGHDHTQAEDNGRKDGIWEEKVDQIRIYSGPQYRAVQEVTAGTVCAVTGLTKTVSGEGLGIETQGKVPVLEPVLTYQIQLPPECDVHMVFLKLKMLEEEIPELNMVWVESAGEIHAQVMGEVQIEILKSMIRERFGVDVEFGSGSIVYKETIQSPAEGVGHFEPLRHYAEVHLLLEPGEPGNGLVFDTACSEDVLDRNWQRLILTHLEEKEHIGVLTGSLITDMKITLTAGRAHQKHTEGGDFRQATYRAVRQGLKTADCVLLEPVYEYRLEVPSEKVGRALSDIPKMCGTFSGPETDGDMSILTGSCPVVTMRDYQTQVTAYTSGRGRLSCTLKGYEPCHNAGEVIDSIGYDSEKDLDHPTGSVFCSHGAGFAVSWDRVRDFMHVESGFVSGREQKEMEPGTSANTGSSKASPQADEKELEEIFARTYGTGKRESPGWARTSGRIQKGRGAEHEERAGRSAGHGERPGSGRSIKQNRPEEEYLLVDGYNIIFAWDDLKELAKVNIGSARNKLMDILCNYQGFLKNTLILVFDAYKVEGGQGEISRYHNIHVVYTKEAETADQYIEKTVHRIGRRYNVTVATSDATEQVIILGQGARRLSAQGLKEEIELINEQIRSVIHNKYKGSRNYLFEYLPEDMTEIMEEVRLGRKTFEMDKSGRDPEE
ncbi:translation factor GTPase family protein [Diplocloster hominis]|uniref:translation factor GTPase family protein n=1 Tax=Diplocloster hominis TaxID=3079010 RepID=UPI0031BB4B32